ncbi:glutathione S-transferase family protein [Zavarzinia sp. CC-PAN008]|uniref:glutathione S-transferase family protein n=1 Tax=Zavarzinia sp. CC-PAN008 TaxID=3243332 RepID=UPI003F74A6F3
MILYGSGLSPFVRKVLVAAAEKGISFDHKPVPPQDKSPDFRAASPFGKIPALVDGDFSVADSTAVLTYFEALKPEPALLPAAAKDRARAIWFEELADTILVPVMAKIFQNRVLKPLFFKQPGDETAAHRAETEELPPILDYLEGQVRPTNTLVGDSFSLADLAVSSPFVNMAYANVTIDPARWPKAAAWLAVTQARPSYVGVLAAERKLIGR